MKEKVRAYGKKTAADKKYALADEKKKRSCRWKQTTNLRTKQKYLQTKYNTHADEQKKFCKLKKKRSCKRKKKKKKKMSQLIWKKTYRVYIKRNDKADEINAPTDEKKNVHMKKTHTANENNVRAYEQKTTYIWKKMLM